MLPAGTLVGGYRIEALLGRGGMATVYEATQLSLSRTVALKVLAESLSDESGFDERFRREAQAQALLDHPHIVTVFEAGESEHGLFIAMRLVKGSSLKQLIRSGEMVPPVTAKVLSQVADALDCAHAAGFVHRDVKPQNILVEGIGERCHAYLADFGVTKTAGGRSLTRTGQTLGTLDYIAPEQVRGEFATRQSDIYSLTAVAYECLTGSVPFPRDTDAAVLYAHLNELPESVSRVGLPTALDAVVRRGLAKAPADRYESASELAGEISAIASSAAGWQLRPSDTLVAPAGRSTSTVYDPVGELAVETSTPTTRTRRWVVAGALAAASVAAAAGLLAGRFGESGDDRTVLESGNVAVAAQAGWARETLRQTSAAKLLPTAALQFRGRADDDAAISRLSRKGADVRFASMLRVRNVTRGVPVMLGENIAVRYSGLSVSQEPRLVGTAYIVPRSNFAVAIACTRPRQVPDSNYGRRCAQLAAAVEIPGDAPADQRPSAAYARSLGVILEDLGAFQRQAAAALRSTREGQGAAATKAAARISALSTRLAQLPSPGLIADNHKLLVRHFEAVEAGYRRLSRAAVAGDARDYALERRRISEALSEVAAVTAALEDFGYRIEADTRAES